MQAQEEQIPILAGWFHMDINGAWKKTCRVLFGEEIGGLCGYSDWLCGLIDTNIHRKSSVSKKDVAYAIREYAENSKWISFDEIDFGKKFQPLSINEIKDIDSILQAISDRAYYAGNIVLGNSGNVQKSTNMSDSFYIHESAQYGDSKYLAYCTVGRLCNYCFGGHGLGESEFCVRCTQTYRDKRSFELWMSQNTSDSYYCYDLDFCSNCIFSFNLRNKRHMVGNLGLEKSRYEDVRKKLISEIVGELKRKKKLPSLLDIVEKSACEKPPGMPAEKRPPPSKLDKSAIEREFSKTTKIIFGKPLGKMDDYKEWLTRHTHLSVQTSSAMSGEKILMLPYVIALPVLPKKRLLTIEEALWLGENTRLDAKDAENLTLANAHEKIGGLAFFNVEFREGTNRNMPECTMSIDSSDCYFASATVYSKYCGCGMWPRSSEHCFGFDTLFDSAFCVKCYHSVKLSRCFELDTCRDCTDSLFCHNCENVHNSMFCFNAKNLRYAIGNAQYPPEKYNEIKKRILAKILAEIEKKKDFKHSIYTIGSLASKARL